MTSQPRTKQRTMFYRRAIWTDGAKGPIEKHLRDAHRTLQTTQDRTFSQLDDEIQGLAIEDCENGLFFHVARYTPGQSTCLVPVPSIDTSKDVSPQSPPDKNNYLEGDVFFLVSGNHIVILPSGAREGVVTSYIQKIFIKAGLKHLNQNYQIEPVLNVDKITAIQKEHVKSVKVTGTLYEATADYIERKTTKVKLLGGIKDTLKTMFGKDGPDALTNADMENLSIKLEISFDQRKKGGALSQERLDKTAQSIIEDEEGGGFKIVTGSGKEFTPDEIKVCEKVKLEPKGNSVFRAGAKEALEGYLDNLRHSGTLEQ